MLEPGLNQTIAMGAVSFDLNLLVAFELGKCVRDYSPLVISLNYTDNG
jgi:hypothetical protein